MRSNLLKKSILLMFISLMWAGCNQKNTGGDTLKSDNMQSEQKEEVYQSKAFTEPGGFPSGIEGPAVDKNGILYAVNFAKPGTIGQVSPDGKASLFVELPEGSVGNGIRFNSKGDMLIADYTNHNILKVDMDTKEVTVFAHKDQM